MRTSLPFYLVVSALGLLAVLGDACAGWSSVVATDDNLDIRVTSIFDRIPGSGYLPTVVAIDNRTNRELQFTVNGFTNSGHGQNAVSGSTLRRVRVPAGASLRTEILIPIPPSATSHQGNARAVLSVSGAGVRDGGRASFQDSGSSSNRQTAFTVVSADLGMRSWGPLAAAAETSKRMLAGSRINPADLSDDWRALAGVSALWITDTELDALKPAQRQTVLDWVRQGGTLYWVTSEDSTRTLAEFEPEITKAKTLSFGLGAIRHERWNGTELATEATLKTMFDHRKPVEDSLVAGYSNAWGLADSVGALRFPVVLLTGFVALFAVAVGPLNLFYFAKPAQRHRLFWTTPLISLVASLLLGGIILFQDGLGGAGERMVVGVLLPRTNQMLIRQEQVSRSGLLLSRDFDLEAPAFVSPIFLTGDGSSELSRNFAQSGNRFSGEWFNSRTVQAQYAEAIVPSRARMELVEINADGAPVLLSSIPHALDRVLYAAADGSVWIGGPVRTGERVMLQPATPAAERDFFQAATAAGPLVKEAWQREPGTTGIFYATATSGPFISTLPAIRWRNDQALFTGPVSGIEN